MWEGRAANRLARWPEQAGEQALHREGHRPTLSDLTSRIISREASRGALTALATCLSLSSSPQPLTWDPGSTWVLFSSHLYLSAPCDPVLAGPTVRRILISHPGPSLQGF